jgi:hypothetical protein
MPYSLTALLQQAISARVNLSKASGVVGRRLRVANHAVDFSFLG